MREERIRPECAFCRELRSLSGERLERLPAEAVGARLRDALRDAACRLRPCELLVVRGERRAAVLARLILAAEERVRYVAEQSGADAGEEEALHGSPGCVRDAVAGLAARMGGKRAAQCSRNPADERSDNARS